MSFPKRSRFLSITGLVLAIFTLRVAGVEKTPGKSELPAPAADEIDFTRHIRPILEQNCFRCHGPANNRGGLRLHTKNLALKGGNHGPVVVPGDSAASRLIRLVAGLEELKMPFEGDPLSAEQIGLLRAWIDQGAKWPADEKMAVAGGRDLTDGHWSFQPIRHPDVPSVGKSDWVRNPIDAFVLRRLQSEEVEPFAEADRSTLIRRLFLDLLGLPPAPEQWARFVNDDQPYAYERLVNRLLASPHFGERWARHWLDLARYADSDGFEKDGIRPHAWRYREWVINAINRDLPYDQFVIEQVAGDLLPNASTEQKVATGFHRNTLTNREGGVDREQFRIEQVVDRTNTTAQVLMGLTVGCAQCHSHKYDPITQHEYYQFLAFFNTSVEVDMPAPLEEELVAYEQGMRIWKVEHERLLGVLNEKKKGLKESPGAQAWKKLSEWEAGLSYEPVPWIPLDPVTLKSSGGATLEKDEAGVLRVSGRNPETDNYTIVVDTSLQGITAFRVEVLTEHSLSGGGPGRANDGAFVLSRFRLMASPKGNTEQLEDLAFERALSDRSLDGFDVSAAIDGKRSTGWALSGADGPNHDAQAVFVLKESIGHDRGTTLTFTLEQRNGRRHNLGAFRLSATTIEPERLTRVLPPAVEAALGVAPEQRSEVQKHVLLDYFLEQQPEVQKLLARIEGHNKAKPRAPDTMAQTIAGNPDPPKTHIHVRGNFLHKGEEVQPGTFEVLPSLRPRGERPDRLDLARWFFNPDHPLTARLEMNRIWDRLFGQGLMSTSEDWGTRGEKPSHPELLDWLASEFMRRGWSRKEMIKLIVTSSTYRQASHVRPEMMEKDPGNVLLARQNRFRVESEITRDLFLAVGGLLDDRVGGPSIRPPLPADIAGLGYANSVRWAESSGTDKYRRGTYIFFQRTVPYPMLMTFDGPDSNTTCIRRTRSNTPLQALTLLNDGVFVECAQAFGNRVVTEGPKDRAERVRYAFRLALAREPSQREVRLLSELLEDQRRVFEMDHESARKFIGPDAPGVVEVPEAAAWVAAARMIMNLDEFLTRE